MPLTISDARAIADEWIAAWNAHDLDRILAHYADEVVMTTPMAVRFTGDPSGTLRGKAALRAYWTSALQKFTDLRFTLHDVLVGVDSLTLYYTSVLDLKAAEVLTLNDALKVIRAAAHYDRLA